MSEQKRDNQTSSESKHLPKKVKKGYLKHQKKQRKIRLRLQKQNEIVSSFNNNGALNIALSILEQTLNKSKGYRTIASFGDKETILKDITDKYDTSVSRLRLKNHVKIKRLATLNDFQPNKKYSKTRIQYSLDKANEILSQLNPKDLGKHKVYLFNPQIVPKIEKKKNNKIVKMEHPVYELLASHGYGHVITVNDSITNKTFNFWLFDDTGQIACDECGSVCKKDAWGHQTWECCNLVSGVYGIGSGTTGQNSVYSCCWSYKDDLIANGQPTTFTYQGPGCHIASKPNPDSGLSSTLNNGCGGPVNGANMPPKGYGGIAGSYCA